MSARYYSIVRGADVTGDGMTDDQTQLLGRVGPVGSVFCLRDLRKHASYQRSAGTISAALSCGMIRPRPKETSVPQSFRSLESVDYWQRQLRGPVKGSRSRRGSTRHLYLTCLWNFNRWLGGRTFRMIPAFPPSADGPPRREEVRFSGVDDLLRHLSDPYSPRSEAVKIVKKYLLDDMHSAKSASYMTIIRSAIVSYFGCNEQPLAVSYRARNGHRTDVPEQRISIPELMQVLTAGRPSVTEKAVFLCKFQRGLDSSTLAEGFNYEALPQLVKWFGSERPEAWDLERCPVPVVLTRVKTDYRHTGFLDRDAVEAVQRYLAWGREQKGREPEAGGPLFVGKFGAPISSGWISRRFSFLAGRAGVRRRIPGTKAYNMDSHELRDLLKSTLIDCGCRYDVADHVIGHRPKDSYDKQALLYPETMRREYAKAAGRLNLFTKFSNVTSGADDAGRIRAEMQDMAARLRSREDGASVLDAAVRRYDSIIDSQRAAGEATARRVERLEAELARLRPAGASQGRLEFCCVQCSTVHGLKECPACGSAVKRIYAGEGRA